MDPCFSSPDRICARHIIMLVSGEFVFKGFCSSVAIWNLLTSMSGIQWAEWGVFLQLQPTLSSNQMMPASCHMSTVCKQCDHTPPSNGQWKRKEKETPAGTASAHLSGDHFTQTGLPLVLGPGRPRLPSSVSIYVFNCPNSWESLVWGVQIQNDTDYRPAVTHWWKFSTIFDSICSPQHTDGRLTGREGEDRRADARTVGRLDTSLTVPVTLRRCGAERLEMQPIVQYKFKLNKKASMMEKAVEC